MADIGDDLLDGDLDLTAFGDLDGEEEDALLADDDYESYQSTRQTVFSTPSQQGGGRTEIFRIGAQVQDLTEGDEILEDGEEDVLELAVVDELDESELDNGQGNNQVWTETSVRTVEADNSRREQGVGVSSSTNNIDTTAGESDEEESDKRGSRFKSERTNIISLKGVTTGKSLSDIPDSLDNVKTAVPSTGMRPRGGMQLGGKGSVRGRLGYIKRGGMMMRGGFGNMRQPNMMPPSHLQSPPGHKIHINPHFRGGTHQPHPSVWDNDRLPPPPGCEPLPPTSSPHKDGYWGGPPPHHMGRPPFASPHPGPPVQFQNPQMYPPSQGYEEQYRPTIDSPQQNPSSRIVQFSENTQLITVENQHFQRSGFGQNFGPPSNQFQSNQNMPPHFNNNVFPNQFNNSTPRPNFQPQPLPRPNPPTHFMDYPQYEYQPPSNPPPFQNVDINQNSWNSHPPPMDNRQNQFYMPGQPPQPQPPAVFSSPQQPQPPFHPRQPPFQNQQPNFRPSQQKQFQGDVRDSVMKRLPPRQSMKTSIVPVKQMRFDHNKQKLCVVNTRSNLQEIKTVDNLPDTTTTQKPEPEIEEDEETKQYRLKIVEQKALREKVLKEKEARRLASIIEKQRQQESSINTAVKLVSCPQPQAMAQQTNRGRGRGRINSANRMIPKHQTQPQAQQQLQTPVVQIQQMLGTMYKIVKVRTKEGAIVTRKTPLVMGESGTTATPMKTVNTSQQVTQRRVVLPAQQPCVKLVSNMTRGSLVHGGNNSVQMASSKKNPGRTLRTVPLGNQPKPQGVQRVVIDKRILYPTMKVAVAPNIPVSTLVTIDNLSLSTSQTQIQKMAKQVGSLSSFKHEAELKRATLKFQKPTEAEQFCLKFHRKMIDLSRIIVTVVPE